MADITMCGSNYCPVKHICYRQTATPSDWQAYRDFYNDEPYGCSEFIKAR